jgi:hypothetical protein
VYWYGGRWRVSTNSSVEASGVILRGSRLDARVAFDDAVRAVGLDMDDLDRTHTHVFELVHPQARLIVPYERPALIYLMSRDMRTLRERLTTTTTTVVENPKLAALIPQRLLLKTVPTHQVCIDTCRQLEFWQGEGLVMIATTGDTITRVKYKGRSYAQEHRFMLETHVEPLPRHSNYVVDKWLDNLGAQLAHFHPTFIHVYNDLHAWANGMSSLYCSLLSQSDTMQARGFHMYIEKRVARKDRRFFKTLYPRAFACANDIVAWLRATPKLSHSLLLDHCKDYLLATEAVRS